MSETPSAAEVPSQMPAWFESVSEDIRMIRSIDQRLSAVEGRLDQAERLPRPTVEQQFERCFAQASGDARVPLGGNGNNGFGQPFRPNVRPKDLGWLDPDYPETYIGQLEVLAEAAGDQAVYTALLQSMPQNHSPVVVQWFHTIRLLEDEEVQTLRTSLAGWKCLIRRKFRKTAEEQSRIVRRLAKQKDETITEYVTRAQVGCMEANRRNALDQVAIILEGLPEEYLEGMYSDNIQTVDALEKHLRSREVWIEARRQKRSGSKIDSGRPWSRQKDEASKNPFKNASTTTSSKPSYEKATTSKPSYEKALGKLPDRPCRTCGWPHWEKGANKTPCPPTKPGWKVFMVDSDSAQSECESQEDADEDRHSHSSHEDVGLVLDQPLSTFVEGSIRAQEEIGLSTYYLHSALGLQVAEEGEVYESKTLGPPGEEAHEAVTQLMIQVRPTADGETQWKPFDTGSSLSFVSKKHLEEYYPNAQVEAQKKNKTIVGIVAGHQMTCKTGVSLDLFLPMQEGEVVRINAYFRVLDVFSPGLLIGNDIATLNYLEPSVSSGTFTAKRVTTGRGHPVGELRCFRQPSFEPQPIKVQTTVSLPPKAMRRVSVAMPRNDTSCQRIKTIAKGVTIRSSEEKGVLMVVNQTSSPRRLTKNTIVGVADGPFETTEQPFCL